MDFNKHLKKLKENLKNCPTMSLDIPNIKSVRWKVITHGMNILGRCLFMVIIDAIFIAGLAALKWATKNGELNLWSHCTLYVLILFFAVVQIYFIVSNITVSKDCGVDMAWYIILPVQFGVAAAGATTFALIVHYKLLNIKYSTSDLILGFVFYISVLVIGVV